MGEQPPRALNLNVSEEAGGWVLRWEGSNETLANNRTKVLYYTVEKRKDKDGEPWQRLAEYIHVEEASYMSKFREKPFFTKSQFFSLFSVKNMGAAKAYLFRVLSHSATSYSVSDTFRYDLPDNVKRRAVTAGLIGGILFFIVAIVLSVCTVKICNKRRRRKHDRGKNLAKKISNFQK